MLASLRIKDIAIIDELDIEFCPYLNIITSVTGHGIYPINGPIYLPTPGQIKYPLWGQLIYPIYHYAERRI